MKLDPKKIKKVLVVGLACIGDTLLSSAALANLRSFLPDAHFTLYTHPDVCGMLEGDPDWQELHHYNRRDPKSPYRGITGRMKAILEWRRGNYDLVIDLRSTLVPLVMNCRYRPLWGLREMFLNRKLHEAERNICCVQSLGVPIHSRDMRIHVDSKVKRSVEAELAPVRDRLVILNPGGKVMKRWPVEKYIEIAGWLEEKGFSVGVIGYIPEEVELGHRVLENISHGLDFTGRVPSSLTAARLSCARLFISDDGGALHMASAVGTPVVAVFGPTDPYRYGPWGNRQRIVYPDNCPKTLCHDEGKTCPIGRDNCIKHVTVAAVKKAVSQMLDESGGEKADD